MQQTNRENSVELVMCTIILLVAGFATMLLIEVNQHTQFEAAVRAH